jgi:hypothetical protein
MRRSYRYLFIVGVFDVNSFVCRIAALILFTRSGSHTACSSLSVQSDINILELIVTIFVDQWTIHCDSVLGGSYDWYSNQV